MDAGAVTSVVALAISVLALIVSSVLGWRQIRFTRVSNETVVTLDWLTRELISESFMESEEYVLGHLSDHHAERGVSGLPPTPRRHVLRVGRYYASLGHLIVFGVVDERLILSLVHHRIYRAWLAIEPYAVAERKIRGAPFFAFFEHVARRSTEMDVPGFHRQLGLETFDKKLNDATDRHAQAN
jgi:hypothetical protein